MSQILIVDDDPHILGVVDFALEQAGHAVSKAENGAQAMRIFEAGAFDLVVLDVLMPEMDGNEVCRRIRLTSNVPIIFLSSRDDEIDRVIGLEIGGDDYITKPFSPRELVARVKAVLRRTAREDPREDEVRDVLEQGAVTLDAEAFVARVSGAVVELTKTEFELLFRVLRRPNKVFSRADLMGGTIVSDRTIDSHVRHIRGKFADAGCSGVIDTVHGVGYRAGACET